MKKLPLILALALALALSSIMPAAAAVPGADVLARIITGEFDTNSDSLIDSGEWQSGLEESFATLDADGDAGIKAEEIDGISSEISEKAGEIAAALVVALVKQAVMSLDANSDKSVSKEEYSKLASEIFSKLDSDKNGSLSTTELAELPAKLIAK